MTATQSKAKFINEWEEYIDECNSLTMTPSLQLSKEVKAAIANLKRLVAKVAEDKGLK